MRLIGSIAVAGLIAAAPGLASAADLLTVPVSTDAAVPVADGFDWNGFYAGVYGVAQNSTLGGAQYGVGVDLGANAQFEFVLVGAEVAIHGLVDGANSTTYAQGLAKLGVAVTDSFVAYGAAGAGADLGPAIDSDLLVGGGLELAMTDDVSVRAQYLHGFPITGGNPKDQVTIGANFHF